MLWACGWAQLWTPNPVTEHLTPSEESGYSYWALEFNVQGSTYLVLLIGLARTGPVDSMLNLIGPCCLQSKQAVNKHHQQADLQPDPYRQQIQLGTQSLTKAGPVNTKGAL